MKTKVYISGHDRWGACYVAHHCYLQGFDVVSSWHGMSFESTETHTEKERAEIAYRDLYEVGLADVLVLIACDERVPGGKFVEVGFALGRDKKVVVIGRRENMLMWLPGIIAIDHPCQLAQVLGANS